MKVRFEVGDLEKLPEANLTPEEVAWMEDSRDVTNIPDGIGHKLHGESGFAWEGLTFGGKTECYYHRRLRYHGTRKFETSGIPHFV